MFNAVLECVKKEKKSIKIYCFRLNGFILECKGVLNKQTCVLYEHCQNTWLP